MRGQLQSTTRRLNRHYQSGGRNPWYWWDYRLTFTSGEIHAIPSITTVPLARLLLNKRFVKFRMTSTEARDISGNAIPLKDFYLTGNTIRPVGVIGYYSTTHLPSDLILFSGSDYAKPETIVNPVTGLTETGMKLVAGNYIDFDLDLLNFNYISQDFNIKRNGYPMFYTEFTADEQVSSTFYYNIYGKMGVKFSDV